MTNRNKRFAFVFAAAIVAALALVDLASAIIDNRWSEYWASFQPFKFLIVSAVVFVTTYFLARRLFKSDIGRAA